jgi:hypothetical protein
MFICQRGYVSNGKIEYELDDGRERLEAAEGEAFFLPGSPCGGAVYREHNLMVGSTHLTDRLPLWSLAPCCPSKA